MTEIQQKPTNPKDALGSTRVDLGLICGIAAAEEALALTEGLLKYGKHNYRIVGVRASIYIAAALRHLFKYAMGEARDPKTGVHHLGYARACCYILLEADAIGKLTDDRAPANPNYSAQLDALEARVKALQEQFKSHNPQHYTIADKT